MIQHIFKNKIGTVINYIIVLIFFQACNSGESTVSFNTDEGKGNDSMVETGNSTIPAIGDGAFNNPPQLNEAENVERRKMIQMQIDSTYAAISLLDEVKKDLNTESTETLTKSERNKKSKAIFNINIIQNELTRALDASILANLKIRTNELAGITRELGNNIDHLQQVTQNLNKTTYALSRLIDLLALGLSNGWIKPMTPKGKAPGEIKAGVN